MKPPKLLSIAAFITTFSLLYVYQQTEVFRLAYVGQKKQAAFEELLDKNGILRYNMKRNTSLVRISDKLPEYTEFQIPDTYRVVRLAPSGKGSTLAVQSPKKESVLSRLFSIKRQAEAKTVKSPTKLPSTDSEYLQRY